MRENGRTTVVDLSLHANRDRGTRVVECLSCPRPSPLEVLSQTCTYSEEDGGSGTEDVAQLAECLPSRRGTLGLTPAPHK